MAHVLHTAVGTGPADRHRAAPRRHRGLGSWVRPRICARRDSRVRSRPLIAPLTIFVTVSALGRGSQGPHDDRVRRRRRLLPARAAARRAHRSPRALPRRTEPRRASRSRAPRSRPWSRSSAGLVAGSDPSGRAQLIRSSTTGASEAPATARAASSSSRRSSTSATGSRRAPRRSSSRSRRTSRATGASRGSTTSTATCGASSNTDTASVGTLQRRPRVGRQGARHRRAVRRLRARGTVRAGRVPTVVDRPPRCIGPARIRHGGRRDEGFDQRDLRRHVGGARTDGVRARGRGSRAAPPRQNDLQLPSDFPSDVRQLALHVTADAKGNAYEMALDLQNYLRGPDFRYSLSVPKGHSDSALEDFLFKTRAGFCEQFSSAFAAMARSIGLPTRVSRSASPPAFATRPASSTSRLRTHTRGRRSISPAWVGCASSRHRAASTRRRATTPARSGRPLRPRRPAVRSHPPPPRRPRRPVRRTR